MQLGIIFASSALSATLKYWAVLPGMSREFKHRVCTWMITEFGGDVNLANVEWDEVWMTEMLRRPTGNNLVVRE